MVDSICAQASTWLYDGSFEGWLSVVFETTRLHMEPARIVATEGYIPELFEETHDVVTQVECASRVWKGLCQRGGFEVASMCRGAFLSELPGIELDLWHYQQKLFADHSGRFRGNVLDVHAQRVMATARKVSHEAHLLTGFVRFQTVEQGTLFATIEPEYRVLELLGPHFSRRFPNQDWFIVDVKREQGLLYQGANLQVVSISRRGLPMAQGALREDLASSGQSQFQKLWTDYYAAINIPERRNPQLMARLLPRKYWKYLPERQSS